MTLPEDFLVSTTPEALQTRLAAYLASPAGARTSGLEPVPFITLELLLRISNAIAACSTAERSGAKQKVVACFVADLTGTATPWDPESCGQKIGNSSPRCPRSVARAH
jgi:hypothetical protein